MTALSAETGKELWHTSYPAPYAPATPAAAHGVGPKATPLFHNGRLYTLGITGIFSAFDPQPGSSRGRRPQRAEHPSYGTAVSPVGDGNLVIVHPGNHGPLTAFDANTGAVKWSGNDRGAYASPIIVELGGIRQVVTMTQESVLGVSLSDGARLWDTRGDPARRRARSRRFCTTETLIVSSQGMGVTALKPTRRGDKWVVDVVWETKECLAFPEQSGARRRHVVRPVREGERTVLRARREDRQAFSGSVRPVRPRIPPSSRPAIFSSC